MKLVEGEVVTFRVTCKNGPQFDAATAYVFGEEEMDVKFVEVEGDVSAEDRTFTMPGLRGMTGKGAYFRVSMADAYKITKGGRDVAGTRAWQEKLDDPNTGGTVELTIQWDPCDGLPSMNIGALWGLDGNKVLDESSGFFPARAAHA